MTLERLTQITSVGISSGITLSSATLTGVTTLTTLSAGGDIDAVNGTFSGNLNVAGVLTYEDVSNVDSVGVITARNTLDAQGNVTVGAGLSVVGVSTLTGNTFVGSAITMYASTGIVSATTFYGDLVGDVTGNINSSGVSTVTTLNATTISGVSTIGVTTATITTLTVNGNAYPSTGEFGNRRMTINGSMIVAQRSTSETGLSNFTNYQTVDRYIIQCSGGTGTYTVTQESDAPSGSGFTKSLKVDCTSSGTSRSAGSVNIQYRAEGQDLQHLAYGTSDAKQVTLSFWFKTNRTGTHAVELYNVNATRQITKQFTVNSADTWEKKTLTYNGDTSGSFTDNNALSLYIIFWSATNGLNTGTFTDGVWANSVTANRLPSDIAGVGISGDYIQLTGVQFETGSVATPFEHRSYGDELARCQRYYYKIQAKASAQSGFFGSSFNRNTTTCLGVTFFPVELRTSPTALEQSGTASDYQILHGTTQTVCTSVPAWWESDTFSARTLFTTGASLTAGQGSILRSASTDAYLAWSAEL